MKLIRNQGSDTVLMAWRSAPTAQKLALATSSFSLFGLQEVWPELTATSARQLILPASREALELFGAEADRTRRGQLNLPALARRFAEWLGGTEVRFASGAVPQSFISLSAGEQGAQVFTGPCALTTEGLGVVPGNPLALIQASTSPEEAQMLAGWFELMWAASPARPEVKQALLDYLRELAQPNVPDRLYHAVLYQVFKDLGGELDEDRIVRSGTGIKETEVWKKSQYPTVSGGGVWDGINRVIKLQRHADSRLNARTSSRKPIFTTLHARRPCAFFGHSRVHPTSTDHV